MIMELCTHRDRSVASTFVNGRLALLESLSQELYDRWYLSHYEKPNKPDGVG
jgi:hypothetical protein